MNKTFNVSVEIYTDDDGIEYVLPDQKELDNLARMILEAEKDAEHMIESKSKPQVTAGKAKLRAVEQSKDDHKRLSEIRKKYLSESSRHTYHLKDITYGEYLNAERIAKTVKEDGTPITDESLMMSELLSVALSGGRNNVDVMELPPNIATILYNRLMRRCWPDASRLPFLDYDIAKLSRRDTGEQGTPDA